MYFAEASDETVRKQLCCHLCSSRFEDPRLLPCGETLCNKCIRNRCENNGDFRCVFCEKTHQVSDELLPENKLIQKLTSNLRSNSKIATKDVDELKSTLSNIERRCRELKDITEKNSIVEIRNYTDFLRNEIDVITESMSQYVYKFNKELVEKVDSYERECIENIKNSSDGFKEFHRLLFDVENFAKYCLSNLDELKDTRASIETGKEHLKRLQIEEVKQKRVKFNHKMLKFKENPTRFNSSLIGELFYSTKIGPVNNQFISSVDLKSILAYQNIDHICVERLENENIALVCSSILKEFNSRLVLLNSCEPWTVLNQSELITNRRFDALFTCKNRNTLFICIVVNFENTVKCLDEELNPFGSLTIDDSPINSLAANSAQLLAWSSIGSKIYSFSYQPEFGLLRTIQLNVQRPNEPFYLPRFVCRMQVDERRFYLLDYDYNLILMDLEGRVTSRFKINSNNFLLTDESVLVVMDRVNSRLVYFDISSGLPIKERKLQTNLVNDDLVAVNSSQFGELFFFSHSDKSIYIYLS